MMIYLLKIMACSAAFYGLYFFVFQKEKMLVFNRFYLLCSLIVSFIIPLITYEVELPVPQTVTLPVQYAETLVAPVLKPESYGPSAAISVAILISMVMLAGFIKNFYRLKKYIALHQQLPLQDYTLVLVHQCVTPHSFLHYIIINKEDYEQGKIADAIMQHERAHIHQKHSWDIIFIELLQAICWFNPIIYLYKRSIRMNHELLADASVVHHRIDVNVYQQLLLQNVIAQNNPALTSEFNFFITKKRLIMLQKKTNPLAATLKGLLCLPLMALLLFVFSEKVYAQKKMAPPEIVKDTVGATQAEMNEYIATMKKNERLIDGKKVYRAENKKQENRLRELVNKMTYEQRKSISNFPPPPPLIERKIKPNEKTPPKVNLDKFTPPIIKKDTVKPKTTAKKFASSKAEKDKTLPPPIIVKERTLPNGTVTRKTAIIEKNGEKVEQVISTTEKESLFQNKYAIAVPPDSSIKKIKQFNFPKIDKDNNNEHTKNGAAN